MLPSPPVPAEDYYLPQFLLLGLPMLVFMAVFGVVALRRRWKYAAIILGAVFVMSAVSLFRDARHRQQANDARVVLTFALVAGVAGLALVFKGFRIKLPPPGKPLGPP